jgi:tetratricopeptide (TPR) repeat protein
MKKAGEIITEANASLIKGFELLNQEKYRVAKFVLYDTYELLRKNCPSDSLTAKAAFLLGLTYYRCQQHSDALAYLKVIDPACRATWASAQVLIAGCYKALYGVKKMACVLTSFVGTLQNQKDDLLIEEQVALAEAYLLWGKNDNTSADSIKKFKIAKKYFEQLNFSEQIALTCLELGSRYHEEGDYFAAIRELLIAFHQKDVSVMLKADCAGHLGLYYLREKIYPLAKEYLEYALKIYSDNVLVEEKLSTEFGLALVERALGNPSASEHHLKAAIAGYVTLQDDQQKLAQQVILKWLKHDKSQFSNHKMIGEFFGELLSKIPMKQQSEDLSPRLYRRHSA